VLGNGFRVSDASSVQKICKQKLLTPIPKRLTVSRPVTESTSLPNITGRELLSNALTAAVNHQARNDKAVHQNYQLKQFLTLASASVQFPNVDGAVYWYQMHFLNFYVLKLIRQNVNKFVISFVRRNYK